MVGYLVVLRRGEGGNHARSPSPDGGPSAGQIPQAYAAVLRAGGQRTAVRAELHRGDLTLVALQDAESPVGADAVHRHPVVASAAGESTAVGADRDGVTSPLWPVNTPMPRWVRTFQS